MSKIFYLYALLLFIQLGSIQPVEGSEFFSDTIWIKMRNQTLIQLCGDDLNRIFSDKYDVKPVMTEFLRDWGKINKTHSFKNMDILYEISRENRINVKERIYSELYLFSEKDSFAFSVPVSNVLTFIFRGIKTCVYFSDFNQLKEIAEMNTDEIFLSLKGNMDSVKYLSPTNSWYKWIEKNEVALVHTSSSESAIKDLLLVGIGTNLQFLRGTWAPGFSGSLSFVFGKNKMQKNKYSLLYDGIYDFSSGTGSFRMNINHFVGIGYLRNFTCIPSRSSWYGISVSYLPGQHSNLFETNTWNIALSHGLNNFVDLQPVMYFNAFFKNVYPSLKVSVHF